MKTIRIVAFALFVLCLPLLLLSSNLRLEVSSVLFYEYGFKEYNAEIVTGIEKSDLKAGAQQLIDYFNGSDSSPQIQVSKYGDEVDLYTQREIDHLRDVKALIQLFYWTGWITLAYVTAYIAFGFISQRRAFLKGLSRAVFWGGAFTLGVFMFFGMWAAVDFDGLFHTFHVNSFSNDLWQLDPSIHHLIMMYPEDFFLDAAVLLIGATLAEAIFLGGVARFYLKKQGERLRDFSWVRQG